MGGVEGWAATGGRGVEDLPSVGRKQGENYRSERRDPRRYQAGQRKYERRNDKQKGFLSS